MLRKPNPIRPVVRWAVRAAVEAQSLEEYPASSEDSSIVPSSSIPFSSEDVVYESSNTDSEQWSYLMLWSYLLINSHATYSDAQKSLILARLEEDYIIDTFGPLGQNKTVCDFFLFFQNSNTTSNLTARTNSKSGGKLRWNYGGGNIYTQNNLPAQTTNGVVTITSADGFSGWTSFNIMQNSFLGIMPSLHYLVEVTSVIYSLNDFAGTSIPAHANNTKIVSLYASNNGFTGTVPDLTALTALVTLQLSYNSFTGNTPNLAGNKATSISLQSNTFTGNGMGSNSFAKAATLLDLRGNNLSVAEVDELLANMDTFYAGANLMTANFTAYLTGANMGTPSDEGGYVSIVSLDAKATGQSVTWTFSVNF